MGHISIELYNFLYHYGKGSSFYVNLAPWLAISIYLLIVFNSKRIFGNKKRKYNAFLWNFFLFILSVAMTLGIGVPYVKYIFEHGWFDSVCHAATAENGYPLDSIERPLFAPSWRVFWGVIFALSKYLELYDTVTLLIKNPERDPWKMPFLLHWFHHWSVLAYCWYATYYLQPTSYIFALVNALIHSFLYYYYAMAELGYKIWWAPYLTIAQTAQMILGIYVNIYYYYQWKVLGYNCAGYQPGAMIISSAVMYAIYFYMFFKMALDRWVFKKYKQA